VFVIVVFLCVTSFETMTTSIAFLIMVFFLCVTCKTKTMNYIHCPGFICVLQVLKPWRQASRSSSWFSFFM
jgi:hypothetical protein